MQRKKESLCRMVDDLSDENQVFEILLVSLVDVLKEKGIVVHVKWEERIRHKLIAADKC